MKTLGIDFGLRKLGVSLATSKLAEPYVVIRYADIDGAIERVKRVAEEEKVESIVIGISDGEIAKKAKEFGKLLKKESKLPVHFFDETLSTQDAQRLAIDAHMKRSKRRKLEDAFAAAVMLQDYLDEERVSNSSIV